MAVSLELAKSTIESPEIQAKRAEVFLAAGIFSEEAKLVLENNADFVSERPEDFWTSGEPKALEFTSKNSKFRIIKSSESLHIGIGYIEGTKLTREIRARSNIEWPCIEVLDFDGTGTHGPEASVTQGSPGWAFLTARMCLNEWLGGISVAEIIGPFMKEKDLSLANILAKTIQPNRPPLPA